MWEQEQSQETLSHISSFFSASNWLLSEFGVVPYHCMEENGTSRAWDDCPNSGFFHVVFRWEKKKKKKLKNKSQTPQVVGYLTTGPVVTICQDSDSWGFWNLALPRLVWWSGSPGGKTHSRASHAGHCLVKGWPPKPGWEGGPPQGKLQNP